MLFPFFSALLGWLGVFLTGSDTSANALFGNLQVVTANQLASESGTDGGGQLERRRDGQNDQSAEHRGSGGGDGNAAADEARLFRFTLRHSIFLATVVGLVVVFYAYVMPGWVR